MKHHFDGLCPNCRQREKQAGRVYCIVCEREKKRAAYQKKHHPVSPEFRALMAEALEEIVEKLNGGGQMGGDHA